MGAVVIILSSALVPGHGFDWTLPITAYKSLFSGAFGSPEAWTSTLLYAAPLALAGLGVALGFKAGLFNIGAQGQFLMGALGAAAVGGAVHDSPPVIAITLAVLGGILAGAVWGGIVGVLKATSGAHEVVTTIMINYIALAVLSWAVSGPLRLPNSPQPITPDVGNAALADHLRSRRPPRHPHRRGDGADHLVPAVSDDAWLRDQDPRGEPRRRAICRDAATVADGARHGHRRRAGGPRRDRQPPRHQPPGVGELRHDRRLRLDHRRPPRSIEPVRRRPGSIVLRRDALRGR